MAGALALAAVLAALITFLVTGSGSHRHGGAIQPPPSGAATSPAQRADDLAHWLRANIERSAKH